MQMPGQGNGCGDTGHLHGGLPYNEIIPYINMYFNRIQKFLTGGQYEPGRKDRVYQREAAGGR